MDSTRSELLLIHDHVVPTCIIQKRVQTTDLTLTMVESATLSQCNHNCVLLDSTNVLHGHSPPTLPEDVPSKRRPLTPDQSPAKRPRLTRPNGDDTGNLIQSSAHPHTIFSLLQTSSRRPPSTSPRIMCMYPLILAHIAHRSLASAQSTFALYTAVFCILTQI